jgi:hypothetical protein
MVWNRLQQLAKRLDQLVGEMLVHEQKTRGANATRLNESHFEIESQIQSRVSPDSPASKGYRSADKRENPTIQKKHYQPSQSIISASFLLMIVLLHAASDFVNRWCLEMPVM